MRRLTLLALGTVLMWPGSLTAQAVPASSDSLLASATRFVEAFYGWYLAQLDTAWWVAVEDRSAVFAPELLSALRIDMEAQANNPEYIVGIDADPFLASQDPCATYHVGPARREGAAILVDVRGDCYGDHDTRPDVVAELAGSPSSWVFVNFRYPQLDLDLMKWLSALRRARDKNPVRAAA